jgi:hypothetical protein
MSVGVIRLEVEMYLECDVDEEEVAEFADLLPDHLMENPIEGIHASTIRVVNKSTPSQDVCLCGRGECPQCGF